ncbi:peptide-methionine (S)-S-oxide reductase MsrA [Nostocoides jenkinsii]|uniref:Peptide methionine sulfoxide reductase MsrA n=1 Tax=Nostocoides jenkinsii Ben 74 TaxID=1193518 RepID=A0A077MEG8_9MICO|nr:peptide-methionine (S)-S-oxide reductase MsrA [Tetrasphaera jenkinsii]CCI54360.1 methionine sulfoxide reductase A [Tetrasphaera jenkinsii Ben 74]
MPTADTALPGRAERPFEVPAEHEVLGTPLQGPWPAGTEVLYIAMGCFWGSERIMWRLPGVVTTAVGYMGGFTANPTYEETCTGRTGHTEAVLVAYDPARIRPEEILKAFWENHDPTTLNRQGNDVGTQYRSAIYWTTPGQEAAVRATTEAFQAELTTHGHGAITTEFRPAAEAGTFWYAEPYHQQYLHKNPGGYCNHGPNGLTCPVGIADLPAQIDVLPPQ